MITLVVLQWDRQDPGRRSIVGKIKAGRPWLVLDDLHPFDVHVLPYIRPLAPLRLTLSPAWCSELSYHKIRFPFRDLGFFFSWSRPLTPEWCQAPKTLSRGTRVVERGSKHGSTRRGYHIPSSRSFGADTRLVDIKRSRVIRNTGAGRVVAGRIKEPHKDLDLDLRISILI